MLQEIGVRFNVAMSGVPCVGDGLRDLQAADTVGAQPMLVLTGKGEKTLRDGGFSVRRERVNARIKKGGARHTILVARAGKLREFPRSSVER